MRIHLRFELSEEQINWMKASKHKFNGHFKTLTLAININLVHQKHLNKVFHSQLNSFHGIIIKWINQTKQNKTTLNPFNIKRCMCNCERNAIKKCTNCTMRFIGTMIWIFVEHKIFCESIFDSQNPILLESTNMSAISNSLIVSVESIHFTTKSLLNKSQKIDFIFE